MRISVIEGAVQNRIGHTKHLKEMLIIIYDAKNDT